MFGRTTLVITVLAFLVAHAAPARAASGSATIDPAKAGPDFAVQGEYVGEADFGNGKVKAGVQVIALGGGKFHAVFYPGGLPGDGWKRGDPKQEADGQTADGITTFASPSLRASIKDVTLVNGKAELSEFSSTGLKATIKGEALALADAAGKELGTLQHAIRKSPTLDEKPAEGAIILFDGKNADEWKNGKIDENGLLIQGPTSKRTFKDFHLHVEFMLSFMPEARGQGRSNSGVYLQGRYEIQVLDSFGLKGENNECGGIYTIKAPEVNMCFPPLSWQTYDADFTAARWEDGKKVQNAKATVRHNGVEIQKDTDIPHTTTSAPVKDGPEPGPIYLQDHGNPVRFRNVWVVEK